MERCYPLIREACLSPIPINLMNSSKTKRKPDQRSLYLPCSPIIHLRAIEQSDYNIGIIEMRFTAGEDVEFSFLARR